MKKFQKWLPLLMVFLEMGFLYAQSNASEKPKDAHIRILNCCDTDQQERWKTGLDLKFKDNYIGRDIRIARSGPLGKISFVGKDAIEVFRTGDTTNAIARLPALLKDGGFYTILVLGNLGAFHSNIDIRLIEEYPFPENELQPGMVRMQLVNAIEKYPADFSVQSSPETPSPKFSELSKYQLVPGEVSMELRYQDKTGKIFKMPFEFRISEKDDYVAVIHPSTDCGDIPSFTRINVAESRSEISAPHGISSAKLTHEVPPTFDPVVPKTR